MCLWIAIDGASHSREFAVVDTSRSYTTTNDEVNDSHISELVDRTYSYSTGVKRFGKCNNFSNEFPQLLLHIMKR